MLSTLKQEKNCCHSGKKNGCCRSRLHRHWWMLVIFAALFPGAFCTEQAEPFLPSFLLLAWLTSMPILPFPFFPAFSPYSCTQVKPSTLASRLQLSNSQNKEHLLDLLWPMYHLCTYRGGFCAEADVEHRTSTSFTPGSLSPGDTLHQKSARQEGPL